MMITIICPDAERSEPISVSGRPLYSAPECTQYARSAFRDVMALTEEPLLREAPDEGLLWRLGLRQAAEPVGEVKRRVGRAADALLKTQTDCIVVAPGRILRFLLRAFEKHRCVIRRARSGAIRPGERIRITERADHCGGCQHNCLLASPGCGVGRDKAVRGY